MSSGMNRTQAEEYAKTMTYKQAISNIRSAKGVAYRKATMIKLHELAEIADKLVLCRDCKHWHEWENGTGYCHRSGNDYNWNWFGVDATDYCSFGERR